MTKQVEVPEGLVETLAGRYHGRMPLPFDERYADRDEEVESAAAMAKARDLAREDLAELLPSIYKHFCDRLLSDEVKEAVARALCAFDGDRFGVGGRWDYIDARRQLRHLDEAAAAITAALQVASIPETCDCSYDRLVTQEQAFAIRAACPVHGPTPQTKEGR